MTALEQHLEHRFTRQAERCYGMMRAAGAVAPFAEDWMSKLLFRAPLKHMRFIPPRIGIEIHSAGRWTISRAGRPIAGTLPLCDLATPGGRPVALVASGPSALEYPLESLRDGSRFVVAVNGSTTLLKEHGVKPDLWVVIDDKFCASGAHHFANAEGVPLAIELVAGATWADLSPDDLKTRPVTFIERVNSWYALPKLSFDGLQQINNASGDPWLLPRQADRKFRVGWSSRPDLGFFSGRTVTYAALQVLVRLGAKDIEIIGMDLGGTSRAYSEDENARPSYLTDHYDEFIRPSFELMSEALRGSEVRIRNLSRTCPLPRGIFQP